MEKETEIIRICGGCIYFKRDESKGVGEGNCLQYLIETSAQLPEGLAFITSGRPHVDKLSEFSCFELNFLPKSSKKPQN